VSGGVSSGVNGGGAKRPPTVMVSVPCGTERHGWINPALALAMLRWTQEDLGVELLFDFSAADCKSRHHARNVITAAFLRSDASHLLMIDNDTRPTNRRGQPVLLPRLALLDLDVIAAPCPFRVPHGIAWNIFDRLPDGHYRTRPIQEGQAVSVAAVGTGAVCIARRVLEQLAEAPPVWIADLEDRDGKILKTEDLRFCERVLGRQADQGGQQAVRWVWAAGVGWECGHYHTIDFAAPAAYIQVSPDSAAEALAACRTWGWDVDKLGIQTQPAALAPAGG